MVYDPSTNIYACTFKGGVIGLKESHCGVLKWQIVYNKLDFYGNFKLSNVGACSR